MNAGRRTAPHLNIIAPASKKMIAHGRRLWYNVKNSKGLAIDDNHIPKEKHSHADSAGIRNQVCAAGNRWAAFEILNLKIRILYFKP
jgi:hypothetical protein